MHRRVAVLGVLLLLGVGAACSTFSGADDPAPVDASTDEVAPVETGVDADAGVDASADAAPQLFVGNQGSIVAMAADGDALFWAVSGGAIMRRELTGANGVASLVPMPKAAEIALDDTYVYWTNFDNVFRIRKDGSGTPSNLETGAATSIAVDATSIYWSNGGDGLVHRLSKSDIGADSATSIQASDPNALALDDTYIFVTSLSGGLQAYPKSVATPVPVPVATVEEVNQHHRLAAGGGAVFYRTLAFGLESVAVHTDNAPHAISNGHVVSHDSDGTSVFWTEDDPNADSPVGVVRRAAPDGTGVTDLATGQLHPTLIVTGADQVYWVAQRDGTSAIMRRPR